MPEVAIDQRIVDFKTPHMYLWSGAVRKVFSANNVSETLMDFSFAEGSFNEIKGFPKPYEYRRLITITLSVAQIPYFRMGDVWLAGNRNFNLLPQPKHFENVESTGREEDFLNVTGLDYGDDKIKSYFINYKTFAVPERFRGGKMIRLRNHESAMDVLIPCFECIRYFFLGSSNLTHEIFSDGLVHEGIFYKDSKFDEEKKTVFAHVPRHILREDARKVAWMISDDRYRDASASVSNSLAGKLDGNRFAFPSCIFPFLGKFKLVARGVAIKTAAGNNFFLVLEIIRVSVSPKFNSIVFAREGNNQEGQELDPNYTVVENRGFIKTPEEGEKEKIVSQSGSSANASVESKLVYPQAYGSAFGEDQDVDFVYEKKKVQRFISANKINIQTDDSTYATNSRGRHGHGKRRATIVPKAPILAIAYDLIFLKIFENLEKTQNLLCQWIHVGAAEGIYSSFPDIKKGNYSWSKVPWEDFRLRRCYIFSATVISTNKMFYFIEIERKYPSDFFSFGILTRNPDFGAIDELTLNLILKRLAMVKGRWCNVGVPESLRLATISHSKLKNTHNLHKDQAEALFSSLGKYYAELFFDFINQN